MKRTLILLTLNEAEAVPKVFDRIPLSAADEVLAVDGGSRDGTIEFLEGKGLRVLVQRERGRGRAFRLAAENSSGEQLVFFSPDGNEDPADIPRLFALLDCGADMAIASRMMPGAYNEEDVSRLRPRKWANLAFTWAANLLFNKGPYVTDTINGFRAVTRGAFAKVRPDADGFVVEYQMSIRAMKRGLKIVELPTREGERLGGASKARSIPTGLVFLRQLAREILAPALLLLAAAATPAPAAFRPLPADEAVFEPMRAEMARSLAKLRLDPFPAPYFLLYRVADFQRLSVSASFGSLLGSKSEEGRVVYVEARSGGAALDNTSLRYRGEADMGALDAPALRQKLWEQSDEAYKSAVAGLLDKKARRATELDLDKLEDFSPQPPAVWEGPSAFEEVSPARLEAYVRRVSEAFRDFPFVYDSRVGVEARRARKRLLTSEGTRIAAAPEPLPVDLYLEAWTRAEDGMAMGVGEHQVFGSTGELPSEAEAAALARRMARELGVDRAAPLQPPAAAPAILDAEFTGVLFHEAIGHKLEGQRQRDPDQMNLFKDRIGERIMPDFLSLVDDPTMESFEGRRLHGHYRFDDEGTPAQRVTLVERGVLRAFLLSRWPVKGFATSNGHGRSDFFGHPTGRMANLMVVAHRTESAEGLKRRLLELCRKEGKPYGFRLVGSSGGENPTGRGSAQTLEVRPQRVFRIDARTGVETAVRGVKLVGTPMTILNRIVAAGDDAALANHFSCGAESGTVPVNQIAPSVLVASVELQRLPESRARPPLLPSPFHDPGR